MISRPLYVSLQSTFIRHHKTYPRFRVAPDKNYLKLAHDHRARRQRHSPVCALITRTFIIHRTTMNFLMKRPIALLTFALLLALVPDAVAQTRRPTTPARQPTRQTQPQPAAQPNPSPVNSTTT